MPRSSSVPKIQPSPLMGVYRFREKIGGCNAWYAVDFFGRIADLQVVRSNVSEKQIVADLVQQVYGKRGPGPALTLIHVPRSASSSVRALLSRGVPAPRP